MISHIKVCGFCRGLPGYALQAQFQCETSKLKEHQNIRALSHPRMGHLKVLSHLRAESCIEQFS